jgi:transcriptional regulator with XRE-family HTH domain
MSTRERPADRGRRLVRAQVSRLVADGREARTAAGLSHLAVGRATGRSRTTIWRLERGDMGSVDTDLLGSYLAVLGLELSLRAYPVADPLRDSGQRAVLERLRRELHERLRWRSEVPFPIHHDLRAWDAEIRPPNDGWRLRVEAEARLTDGQAIERRLALKLRDGGPGHVALLLPDTRHNRAALERVREELRPLLPLDGRRILAALRAGEDPGGSGIVVL